MNYGRARMTHLPPEVRRQVVHDMLPKAPEDFQPDATPRQRAANEARELTANRPAEAQRRQLVADMLPPKPEDVTGDAGNV